MAKAGVSLEAALRMGMKLAGVEASTSWGAPSLKVRGQLMACVPTNKSAEPGSLLIRMDRNDRAAMLAESPERYYAPEHYVNYDAVLVRLAQVDAEVLQDLLGMAHRFVTRPKRKR